MFCLLCPFPRVHQCVITPRTGRGEEDPAVPRIARGVVIVNPDSSEFNHRRAGSEQGKTEHVLQSPSSHQRAQIMTGSPPHPLPTPRFDLQLTRLSCVRQGVDGGGGGEVRQGREARRGAIPAPPHPPPLPHASLSRCPSRPHALLSSALWEAGERVVAELSECCCQGQVSQVTRRGGGSPVVTG